MVQNSWLLWGITRKKSHEYCISVCLKYDGPMTDFSQKMVADKGVFLIEQWKSEFVTQKFHPDLVIKHSHDFEDRSPKLTNLGREKIHQMMLHRYNPSPFSIDGYTPVNKHCNQT